LEIVDKLCCSFGQDIFDSLYWMSVATGKDDVIIRRGRRLSSFTHFFVALVYVYIHSLVLFYQVVTLNVAINSYNNALLTLLVSNQFVELKGSVFKKFEKENLFQISCSDMVERFQLFIFLAISVVQNLRDMSWDITWPWVLHMGGVVVAVWLSETLVDAIKHAFITKFNAIRPDVYLKFKTILARDMIDSRSRTFMESSWAISKRIGFVPLPLGCLVLRVFSQTVPISGWLGLLLLVIVMMCLSSLKVLLRILLLGKSLRALRISPAIFSASTQQMHNVSRFDMVKGKIP